MPVLEDVAGKFRGRRSYVVDENGSRVGVLLDIEEYHQMLEELEELDSIHAYDAARMSSDEAVPFEQAVAEIERERQ